MPTKHMGDLIVPQIHLGLVDVVFFFFNPYSIIYLLIWEREKHRCKRETSIGCFPYAPQLGIKPTIVRNVPTPTANKGLRGLEYNESEGFIYSLARTGFGQLAGTHRWCKADCFILTQLVPPYFSIGWIFWGYNLVWFHLILIGFPGAAAFASFWHDFV